MAISVVIYGASGNAVGMRDMIVHGFGPDAFEVVAFIDDFRGGKGEFIDAAPVIDFPTWRQRFHHLPVIVSVGDPSARRNLVGKVSDAGGRFAAAYRVMGAVSPSVIVGDGSVVGYPAYVGPSTTIGRHVLVMTMAVLGHDVQVGDFVTICSSASVAGYVVIEDDVFVGVAAVIVNGTQARPIRIGRGARIAAGAVVTKSVAAGASVAGNPARDVRELAAERLSLRKLANRVRHSLPRRMAKITVVAALLVAALVAVSVIVSVRDRAQLQSTDTCYLTGGGTLRVCHAASDESVFYRPSSSEVAYNTQIVSLGSGRYATVLHSEAEDMAEYLAQTRQLRPGDSIKTGEVDASSDPAAMMTAPSLNFGVWGSLTNPQSPLYYAYDPTKPTEPGLSGGGNPMVVSGLQSAGDPYFYVFYLAVVSDGGKGLAWRNELMEARTQDFAQFDVLQKDASGAPSWVAFAGDDTMPAPVTDTAGNPIESNQAAVAVPPGSAQPGQPAGAIITAGVFGSISYVNGTYYYFYTDQDPDDASVNHLYVRTASDVSTNARWSTPQVVMNVPPQILIRVAQAQEMNRWTVAYNCLRSVSPFVSDICLQYTSNLNITGPGSIASLRLFDGNPYTGFSRHALGLVGSDPAFMTGTFLKVQHFWLTDTSGNLVAPPGSDSTTGGLLTWTELGDNFDIYGAPVYTARWQVTPVSQ